MGALEDTAVVAMAGDECVDGGRGCARGVFRVEFADTAGELWVWGVVGVLGSAPLPEGPREGFLEEPCDGAADDCCW